MTINTTNINGYVVLPNDTVRDRSHLTFQMIGFDTDEDDRAVVVPFPIDVPISPDGSIDVNLWPNPEGVRGTLYAVTAYLHNGIRPVTVPLGSIIVPVDGGPYDLNDLLPVAPPQGASLEDYLAYLEAAVSSIQNNVDQIHAMTAEASTVDHDEPAAASYDPNTGVMYFDIPQGEPGVGISSVPSGTIVGRVSPDTGMGEYLDPSEVLDLVEAVGYAPGQGLNSTQQGDARDNIGLGTAATVDHGTDPGEVPLNSDLGSMAVQDAGDYVAVADKATQAEAQAGADDTKWMTPARVADVALGMGQEWVELTASRYPSTSYQNTTGRPIFVSIVGRSSSTSGRELQISDDGVSWRRVGFFPGSASGSTQTGIIVKHGQYYRVDGDLHSSYFWSELR